MAQSSGNWAALLICGALSAPACGGETAIGQTRSTDEHGAGGNGSGGHSTTGGTPASGGAPAMGGDGTGGAASGGTENTGGNDNTGGRMPVPLPEGPDWDPPFTVGVATWRDSTERFCPHRYGPNGGPKVWSDAEAVFALFAPSRCPLDPRGPCNGEGTSLYENSGKGWRLLLDDAIETSSPSLSGYPGASPIVYGGGDCHLQLVNRDDGSITCSWSTSAEHNDNVVAVSAISGAGYALTQSGRILNFGVGSWSEYTDLFPTHEADYSPWTTLFASGTTTPLLVAGTVGRVIRVNQPRNVQLMDPGSDEDFVAIWEFSQNDVWFAMRPGTLVHFDGSQWTPLVHPEPLEVYSLWGSPQGTLFFHTQTEFGRVRDGKAEILAEIPVAPGGSPSAFFSSLWGNSDTEVFLGIQNRTLAGYRCSGAYIAHFNGELMHLF